MRAESLAQLFAAADVTPTLDVVTGSVVSFDPDTGSNVIRVAGASVPDVPLLTSDGLDALRAGDVVSVLRRGTQLLVLGRMFAPDGEAPLPSPRRVVTRSSATATLVAGSTVDVVAATVAVPAWATVAVVDTSMIIKLTNNSGATGSFRGGLRYVTELSSLATVTGGLESLANNASGNYVLSDVNELSVGAANSLTISGYAASVGGTWSNVPITLSAAVSFRAQ